jgi:hypothetical protein
VVINLAPPLEAAISNEARQRGIAPEVLVLDALRDRFLPKVPPVEPRDEWERKLFEAALDCGVSVPDWALSREVLYD